MLLLSSAEFFQVNFSKEILGTKLKCQNGLHPDQDLRSVGPDLGPNCFQRLSAGGKNLLLFCRHYLGKS